MNNWQLLRQVRYLIRAAAWSANYPLFQSGSVLITKDLPEVLANFTATPFCLVYPSDQQPDPEGEEPGFVMQGIGIAVCVSLPADGYGQSVLLGANRDPLKGENRGVLEIMAPLRAAVRRLNDAAGARILAVADGESGVQKVPEKGYIGFGELRLRVYCTDAKFFHTPTRFVATPAGGGAVTLTWRLPPDRFDYRRVILRRAAGSTPPASATTGTGITLGGTPDGRSAVTVSDSPGAGTFSYSLFAAYNDYSITDATQADAPIADTTSAVDKDFSAAVTRAAVAVT